MRSAIHFLLEDLKMLCTISQTGSRTVACISGTLDSLSVAKDRDVAARILAQGSPAISLDMADVSFLDASGLGMIVHILKHCRNNGISFKVENLRGQPAEFLSRLGLDLNLVAQGARPRSSQNVLTNLMARLHAFFANQGLRARAA